MMQIFNLREAAFIFKNALNFYLLSAVHVSLITMVFSFYLLYVDALISLIVYDLITCRFHSII